MGLDDLWRVELALVLLALLLTLFVSGLVTLGSYGAWRWSLSLLVKGRGVSTARLVSVPMLGLAGLPLAYALGLLASLPGFAATAALSFVLVPALAALVHAAFRDEAIRHLCGDSELAATVGRLDAMERSGWLRNAGRLALPSLKGSTKQRTLKSAAAVAVLWTIPLAILRLVHS